MNQLPEAGVGIVYLPGLEQVLESHLQQIDVIEIEPQTLWYNKDASCDSFLFNNEQTEAIAQYSCPKLFHSVGFPVGGRSIPVQADLALLNQHAAMVSPLWISEHLSFNRFEDDGKWVNTNFLLPPAQTIEGVDTAVRSISHFMSATHADFALETGVNYLQQQAFEINDGDFVALVAEKADCHILLDLHNILANQLNGRQSVNEFVNRLPLKRVCELHLAGGFVHDNYYIDGHSGVSSDELFTILNKLVQRLPCLKAIIFEMLPEYAGLVNYNDLHRQFEKMHRVWDRKGKGTLKKSKYKPVKFPGSNGAPAVKEWEYCLGKAAIEQSIERNDLFNQLSQDKGVAIINELVFNFRASMVVTTLQLSTRLLRLYSGNDFFNSHLKQFFAGSYPAVFAFSVAQQYAAYLQNLKLSVPFLDKTIEYELASLQTITDKQVRQVNFNFNPFPVFRSLMNATLPLQQDMEMSFVLTLEPDDLLEKAASFNYFSVYHN